MNRTRNFEELQKLINEIEQSEGERILREILNMQASLRLVKRNYQELVQTINAFQQEKAIIILHDITKRDVLNEVFEVILTRLHNFLAAAFSLIDHMRRHRKHLYASHAFNKEIDTKVHDLILSKPHHKVAQGLRKYCLHVSLPPIASRTLIERDQLKEPLKFKESIFYIPLHSLLSWDGWSPGAKVELKNMPNGLAILPFATEYFKQLEGFYTWLWGRQSELHKIQINETNNLKDKARMIYKELNPNDPRL